MFTLVIGGSASGVGKTTLVCALLRALPEFDWTAIKISSHDHGLSAPVYEEPEGGEGSDTSRYLAAGACRALLVSAPGPELPLAELQAACYSTTHALIESNRIVDHLCPDICLAVVGEEAAKHSFASPLHRADAVIVRSHAALDRVQAPVSACVFCIEDCNCPPPELVAWIRGRVSCATAS